MGAALPAGSAPYARTIAVPGIRPTTFYTRSTQMAWDTIAFLLAGRALDLASGSIEWLRDAGGPGGAAPGDKSMTGSFESCTLSGHGTILTPCAIACGQTQTFAAALTEPPRALVVSIHDVSPRTWTAMRAHPGGTDRSRAAALLAAGHPGSSSGEGHSLDDEGFCAWLAAQVEAGHELVIHGYYAPAPTSQRRKSAFTIGLRLACTPPAKANSTISTMRPAAAALVGQAREEFREAGFDPDGFIAPAWLLSTEAEDAIRGIGFQYDPRCARSPISRPAGAMIRSRWSGACVPAGGGRRAWPGMRSCSGRSTEIRLCAFPSIRSIFFIRRIWRQIRRCVAVALQTRAAYTYERWIARQRALDATAAR